MGAKSYYFENNQIKSFEDPIEDSSPKNTLKHPYNKVLEGVNILIVDDNPINLIVAEKTLKRFGASTFKALSGELGIECFEKEEIDLVLMDIQMPMVDGFESCKRLKATKKYSEAQTPVIAYTTFAFEEVQDRIKDANMDGYIGKPFTQAHVISSLLNIVSKSCIKTKVS